MKVDILQQYQSLRDALRAEKTQLETRLREISGALGEAGPVVTASPAPAPAPAPSGRRVMSAAGRARIAAAQRARWAKARGAQESTEAPARPKRKMSAAARARISAAAAARWAKAKAAGRNSL